MNRSTIRQAVSEALEEGLASVHAKLDAVIARLESMILTESTGPGSMPVLDFDANPDLPPHYVHPRTLPTHPDSEVYDAKTPEPEDEQNESEGGEDDQPVRYDAKTAGPAREGGAENSVERDPETTEGGAGEALAEGDDGDQDVAGRVGDDPA